MPATRNTAAVLLAALVLSTPAAAEDWPIAPGFWAFPHLPDFSEDDIAGSCASGFSLVFSDGHEMSFLIDFDHTARAFLVNDAISQCTRDPVAGIKDCEVTILDGSAPVTERTRVAYRRDEGGLLIAEAHVLGTGRTVVSYPRMCPDWAIRWVLGETLAPQ